MWRTQCGKSPREGGILPVYVLTTFCSHSAAKFSVQIVSIPMQTVCIPEGKILCIHLFRTVGDSNPALIINEFGRAIGSCLRGAYGRKIAVRILLGGAPSIHSSFCTSFKLFQPTQKVSILFSATPDTPDSPDISVRPLYFPNNIGLCVCERVLASSLCIARSLYE